MESEENTRRSKSAENLCDTCIHNPKRGGKRDRVKEFSKKILIAAGIVNAVVIIFTMIMIWRTLDITPLAYLIPSVAAEVATGTGFYYSKAKVENRIKLMRQYKVAPQEQHFSDNF